MPKFLDAPSWYDNNGDLKTIEGDFSVRIGAGHSVSVDIPYVGGTGLRYLDTITARALVPIGTSAGQIPYWYSSTQGYSLVSTGDNGEVLLLHNNYPTWGNPGALYYAIRDNYDGTHNYYIIYNINGDPMSSSSNITGQRAIVSGKSSGDRGDGDVVKNRIVTIGNYVSANWFEITETNYFFGAPEVV